MQLHNDMRWFDRARDLDAVKRIWREVGWADDRDDELAMEPFFSIGRTLTGVIDGSAECAVHATPGLMRLDATDLSLAAITAVTTSRIGRRRGFAQRLTAMQLAVAADAGAKVAALGMFDQGFYDRVGFGNGTYQNVITFDPATLRIERDIGAPKRISADDWRAVHECMRTRLRGNGGCVLMPPETLESELAWSSNGFGLGYYEGDALTHFIWCSLKEAEHGPLNIDFLAYRKPEQLMQLLALVRSLGDQYRSVTMTEPVHIRLQDWLATPFRNRDLSRGSRHAGGHRAPCWWQLRVLDVPGAVAALRAVERVDAFAVEVHDPAVDVLAGAWKGTSGRYIVTLDETSHAERAGAGESPQLRCSVNALSRLLFGVVPASVLALGDDFDASPALIDQLDRAIRLPTPWPGWEF